MSEVKLCTKCDRSLNLSMFTLDKTKVDGHYSSCKECRAKYLKTHSEKYALISKIWREKNPNYSVKYKGQRQNWEKINQQNRQLKQKENRLLRNYKITTKIWNDLFNAQHGNCACCGEHQSNFNRNFDTDHDHKTGKVRGLLCLNCNKGLGMFKDSPSILLNAANYIINSELADISTNVVEITTKKVG